MNTLPVPLRLALLVVRVVLALAFVAAGAAKLFGVPMMVEVFDQIGLGQWLRYLTAVIEVGCAVLLLIPRSAGVAAVLLAGTMAVAVLAHLTVLPGSPAPAAVLSALCAIVAWFYRTHTLQLLGLGANAQVRA